jgi:hypothetical protein
MLHSLSALALRAGCALAFVAAASSLAPVAALHVRPPARSITVHGVGQGPKMCVDCEAPGAVSITLCHSATVAVTVGATGIGTFGTGQSTSACVTAPAVGPDTCVWMEYHYSCTRSGFFGTWQCTPTGANTKFGDNPYC